MTPELLTDAYKLGLHDDALLLQDVLRKNKILWGTSWGLKMSRDRRAILLAWDHKCPELSYNLIRHGRFDFNYPCILFICSFNLMISSEQPPYIASTRPIWGTAKQLLFSKHWDPLGCNYPVVGIARQKSGFPSAIVLEWSISRLLLWRSYRHTFGCSSEFAASCVAHLRRLWFWWTLHEKEIVTWRINEWMNECSGKWGITASTLLLDFALRVHVATKHGQHEKGEARCRELSTIIWKRGCD